MSEPRPNATIRGASRWETAVNCVVALLCICAIYEAGARGVTDRAVILAVGALVIACKTATYVDVTVNQGSRRQEER